MLTVFPSDCLLKSSRFIAESTVFAAASPADMARSIPRMVKPRFIHMPAASPAISTPSPTSSGCIFIPASGTTCAAYSTSLPPAISGATAGCCLKFSSICGTDFSRLSDDEDRRPAPGKGCFIRIQEATAHQTIGWRPGKQTGGTFVAL